MVRREKEHGEELGQLKEDNKNLTVEIALLREEIEKLRELRDKRKRNEE